MDFELFCEPKFKKCNECHQKRRYFHKIHRICHLCYNSKRLFTSSGNKVIDDFIKYTLTNRHTRAGKMEFVRYDRFKDVNFIAEGGFSKIYKATWIDSNKDSGGEITVVLKELNHSKNISSKELNEVWYFLINFNVRF